MRPASQASTGEIRPSLPMAFPETAGVLRPIRTAWLAVPILQAVVSGEIHAERPAGVDVQAGGAANAFHAIEGEGLEHAFDLGGNLISGAQPRGEAAFATLARLGVRTLISVDGIPPDTVAAARQGLRYIHIPIGYGGIARTNALRLARAVSSQPGPVYLHCHHGKHRGPAAAGLVGRSLFGWDAATADAWLAAAGTDPLYGGLRRDCTNQAPVSVGELSSVPEDFPSRVDPSPLVDTMTAADGFMDSLKASRVAGFPGPTNPATPPDSEAALQIRELLGEAVRSRTGGGNTPGFLGRMEASERAAAALVTALRDLEASPSSGAREAAGSALKSLSQTCTDCHRQFRDGAGSLPKP